VPQEIQIALDKAFETSTSQEYIENLVQELDARLVPSGHRRVVIYGVTDVFKSLMPKVKRVMLKLQWGAAGQFWREPYCHCSALVEIDELLGLVACMNTHQMPQQEELAPWLKPSPGEVITIVGETSDRLKETESAALRDREGIGVL
jgi:hypothetical protein